MKNDGVLPLSEASGRVLLTGPFVDDGDALLGTWVLDGRGEEVVTPADALRARFGEAEGTATASASTSSTAATATRSSRSRGPTRP